MVPVAPVVPVVPVVPVPVIDFWKWNSKCKKSCCFEGLGSLF